MPRVSVIVSTAFWAIAAFAQTDPPLPALNIDTAETSVSGLSSGAFMAVQLGVAYSSIVKGVGVVAGGPYYCAQDSVATATTRCSCTIQPASLCAVTSSSADVPALVTKTRAFAASSLIDDTSHLGAQRVIMISGASDATVPRAVVRQLASKASRCARSAT